MCLDVMVYTTRSNFDVFVKGPVQGSVQSTRVTLKTHRLRGTILNQIRHNDRRRDLRGYRHYPVSEGKAGSAKRSLAGVGRQQDRSHNVLQSLFSQFSGPLNGVSVSSFKVLYNYGAYNEILLIRGSSTRWILISPTRSGTLPGEFIVNNPPNDSTNRGYRARLEADLQLSRDRDSRPRLRQLLQRAPITFSRSKASDKIHQFQQQRLLPEYQGVHWVCT